MTVAWIVSVGAAVIVLSVVLVPVGVGSALVAVPAGLIISAGVVATSGIIGGPRVVGGQCRVSVVTAAVVAAVAGAAGRVAASITWIDDTGGDGQSGKNREEKQGTSVFHGFEGFRWN